MLGLGTIRGWQRGCWSTRPLSSPPPKDQLPFPSPLPPACGDGQGLSAHGAGRWSRHTARPDTPALSEEVPGTMAPGEGSVTEGRALGRGVEEGAGDGKAVTYQKYQSLWMERARTQHREPQQSS